MTNTKPRLKRQAGGFRWTSGVQRLGHPIYWYSRQGDELWFVNSSEDVLSRVTSSGAGSATLDDEDVFTTSETTPRIYHDVKPGEGVLVDEFDNYYDLDLLVYTQVDVVTKDGHRYQLGHSGKGGSRTCRLLSPGDLTEE